MSLIKLALPLSILAASITAMPLPDSAGSSLESQQIVAREPKDTVSEKSTLNGPEPALSQG